MRKKSDHQIIIERLLICPDSSQKKIYKSFWSRESAAFFRLYKMFPDYTFWHRINFKGSISEDSKGRIKSFLLFFDVDGYYWINLLKKKWKTYKWQPDEIKSLKINKNNKDAACYKINKKNIRNFFKK